MIVDARGQVLASIETATDAVVAPVTRDHLDEVRRINPALQLRRFGVVPL